VAAYLTGKKLGTQQWYAKRNRPLTGCTVMHSSEGVMDTIGPDTGAEALAEFIRTRTTAGSYHDIADSDSGIQLVEWEHGAFHDATGSNNWALSISFALRTIDWARMSPEKRRGFLWQGALRFVAQQQWRKRTGAPLTRLRYITKAQSDAGESGFCCHGWRDPGRRTDPGTTRAAEFPFDEWLAACAQALAQYMPDHPEAGDDDMSYSQWPIEDRNKLLTEVREQIDLATPGIVRAFLDAAVTMADGSTRTVGTVLGWSDQRELDTRTQVGTVADAITGGDPDALAKALKDALGDQLAADVAARLRITPA
jgi:hypothetical protein